MAANGWVDSLDCTRFTLCSCSAEVFRKVLAALVAQHVFLCICALVGIQMHMMQIEPPGAASTDVDLCSFLPHSLCETSYCWRSSCDLLHYVLEGHEVVILTRRKYDGLTCILVGTV